MINKINLEEELYCKRFNDLSSLKELINCTLKDKTNLIVKDIAHKSYYDNDFQDWEIMATIGDIDEDLYDITIYYAICRQSHNIIVEVSCEEI